MLKYLDNRKLMRLHLELPVTCRILDSTDSSLKALSCVSRNINSEGIYFELGRPLSLEQEVEARFHLPKAQEETVATMKILRIDALGENRYGVGGTFVKIQPKDRENIKQMIERSDITKLLELTINKGASDLHLVTNSAPVLRINGELERDEEYGKLGSDDIQKLIFSFMSRQQIRKFEEEKELDFGLQYDLKNRFRINLHQQRGSLGATLRLINGNINSMEELNIPEAVKDLARLNEGLVLITGPAGSGKTTTVAAIVELINQERKSVIITLERPIEYVHINAKSIVEQREIGVDSQSFSVALKSTLRQDPNVIVIGELDDAETIKTAITASEAGYLVIASFHAPNTIQAIDRLVSMFPSDNRKFILSQLANCLKGVICQLLIPCRSKKGRVLATEIVITNDAVKRIIRTDDLVQLSTVIQTGAASKMQTMYESINNWINKEVVDPRTAGFYSAEFNRPTNYR